RFAGNGRAVLDDARSETGSVREDHIDRRLELGPAGSGRCAAPLLDCFLHSCACERLAWALSGQDQMPIRDQPTRRRDEPTRARLPIGWRCYHRFRAGAAADGHLTTYLGDDERDGWLCP